MSILNKTICSVAAALVVAPAIVSAEPIYLSCQRDAPPAIFLFDNLGDEVGISTQLHMIYRINDDQSWQVWQAKGTWGTNMCDQIKCDFAPTSLKQTQSPHEAKVYGSTVFTIYRKTGRYVQASVFFSNANKKLIFEGSEQGTCVKTGNPEQMAAK